jgi:HTH-type transcriptional regulator/antitoxin HigA
MGIYPIRNEADYTRALARIETLMDSKRLTTDEGVELDALVTLVEAYEQKHFPIGDADPIAMIEFGMDQQGLTRKELEPMIGSRARVSEVLSGKRNLTLAMIRRLSAGLHIPADLLIGAERSRRPAARTSSRSAKRVSRQVSISRYAGASREEYRGLS